MRTRLRRTLARQLHALAHRIDPTYQYGHNQHVHVTVRADTSGMVEALERAQDRLRQELS